MHHAYLLIGDVTSVLETIDAEDRVPSADVIHYTYDRFTIRDARSLKYEASLMPIERSYRVFILVMESMTHEAQNALLKLFEDPVQTVKFYIITKRAEMFIPTLRSRLNESVRGDNALVLDTEITQQFLHAPYDERLNVIATKMKNKENAWADVLLDGLELWLEQKMYPESLKDLLFVRSYMRTQSASRKMLLEHLALTLPITK